MWDEAAPLTEEAVNLIRRSGGSRSRSVADALGRRALVIKNLDGDQEGARELYLEALAMLHEIEGPVHPQVANLHNQLGVIAAALGDLDAAIAAHHDALEVRQQLYPQGHWETGRSHQHLGLLYRRQGDTRRAADQFGAMVRLNRKLYKPTDNRLVGRTLLWCESLIDDARPEEAEALLRVELSPEHRAARPAGSRLLLQAEGLLGAARHAQGKADGKALLQRSLETLRGNPKGFEEALAWLERYWAKSFQEV